MDVAARPIRWPLIAFSLIALLYLSLGLISLATGGGVPTWRAVPDAVSAVARHAPDAVLRFLGFRY